MKVMRRKDRPQFPFGAVDCFALCLRLRVCARVFVALLRRTPRTVVLARHVDLFVRMDCQALKKWRRAFLFGKLRLSVSTSSL